MDQALNDAVYYPDDIEAASGGYLTKRVRQHIDDRGQWHAPLLPTVSGRKRPYTLAHAYEAAIIAALTERGFTIGFAHQAIRRRCISFMRDRGVTGGWAGDAMANLPQLPELQHEESNEFWMIDLGPTLDRKSPPIANAVAAGSWEQLAELSLESRAMVLLAISPIVRDVNAILRERLAKREHPK